MISYANAPTMVPWPVGSTETIMNSTKTLMNSYGDPQNNWDLGSFHCGIDFDAWTEPPLGTTLVRCVHGIKEPTPPDVVITRIIQDYERGYYEYAVVTTAGTSELDHEDYGWCYEHLSDPYFSPDQWEEWDTITEGDFIAAMQLGPDTRHTHFKWTTWDFDNWCYVNPLDYLTPTPTGSNYTWTFNPEGYTNDFEYFFLEDMPHSSWPESTGDVISIMMDKYLLYGEVDVFFGFGLSGVGQNTTPECGRNDLAPERIK